MKRLLKLLIQLILTTIAAAVLYVGFLHHWTRPYFARRDSIRILAAATTEQEFKRASNSLGAFLTFPDHSWLALRYVDSHAGGIWSVAMARDSGGNWYESREHFCGTLGTVREHQLWLFDKQESPDSAGDPDPEPPGKHSKWLRFVSDSPNLETARQRLISEYFKPLSPG